MQNLMAVCFFLHLRFGAIRTYATWG